MSKMSETQLQDGTYVPLLFVGTGPNGIAGLAEIARINPGLLEQSLVVDNGELPGGPFAVPRGPAWRLNSANGKGTRGLVLGESPVEIEKDTGVAEEKTVTAYGSPIPSQPGARIEGEDTRGRDINTLGDYFATLTSIDNGNYGNNDELALLAQMQAAMLIQNLALKTEVVSVEPSTNTELPGNKTVTLRITGYAGEPREVRIQTDSLVVSSGLGKPTYGFELEGSSAQGVLDAQEDSSDKTAFPKLSDTLTAFRALASRDEEPKVLGDTLIIYGSGNSTDTLVEYIGGIFEQAENPAVKNVKKIYVVTTGKQFSERERYAMNADLAPKSGRANLVEFVTVDRVADVDFVEATDREKVTILDGQRRPITDKTGKPVSADSVIAATGFVPQLDEIFAAYLEEGETLSPKASKVEGSKREALVLPTNPDVAVADTVSSDPSIIFIGTASRPAFNAAKFEQLPPESREALIRNGAENAVAIGFRRPDDQAAMRLFIPELQAELGEAVGELTTNQSSVMIPLTGTVAAGTKTVIKPPDIAVLSRTRKDVPADSPVLTPLFLFGLGRVRSVEPERGSKKFTFELVPGEDGLFNLTFLGSADSEEDEMQISGELLGKVTRAFDTPKFWSYLLNAPRVRRQDAGFRVTLGFRNGTLDLKNTSVEPL